MGNGQKAQTKRDRNLKNAKTGPGSQLKTNAVAKNIICKTCFQDFLCTSREKALSEHSENKHNKTIKECFPDWSDPTAISGTKVTK